MAFSAGEETSAGWSSDGRTASLGQSGAAATRRSRRKNIDAASAVLPIWSTALRDLLRVPIDRASGQPGRNPGSYQSYAQRERRHEPFVIPVGQSADAWRRSPRLFV